MKYADSGVDIDTAQRALAKAKAAVRSTWDERVQSEMGCFGGLFRPTPDGPLLVSSVDGVGTKVKVATLAGRFDTIGQDIINHCVDDILVQGAEPLFFLDYFATSKLDEVVLPAVLEGLSRACRENGCALLGGETAEMPGVYCEGEFDLAGCIVGQVDPEHLIDGSAIGVGDRVWGLPSTGLHTNGYTLARTALLEHAGYAVDETPPGLERTVGDALLAVHRSYLPELRALWKDCGRDKVHGLAHITGGGFYDNIPRVVPEGLCVRVEVSAWTVPPLFGLIAAAGEVETSEMYRVFNMGIGMVVVLDAGIDPVAADVEAIEIGVVTESADRRVEVVL